MSRREIANLCCRVLAVYSLLVGLGLAPRALSLLWPFFQTRMSTTESVIVAIANTAEPLMWIASGLFLWRWSGLIAAWMIGTDLHDNANEPESTPQRATPAIACAIAFSTVGLWVLVDAGPRLLSHATTLITYRVQAGSFRELNGAEWAGTIVEELLRIAIGLYLLFGATGLVGLVRNAKNVGLMENERPEFARDADSEAKPGASG